VIKKNILIISVYYPPIQSIASNRIYSFAKYLNKDIYNVHVHTMEEEKQFNNDLFGVEVTRSQNRSLMKPFTFTKRTNRFIHYSKVAYNIVIKKIKKNIYQKWIDESYELLKNKIKQNNIDLILSSFSPDASHLVALKLKKDFPNIKWIADMRDEMSCSPFIDKRTEEYYKGLEQEIFKSANAITSVSKPILDDFRSLSNNEKLLYKEIRNGYDFEIKNLKEKNDIFTIGYIGNFYGGINPNNFLKALTLLIEESKIVDFNLKFIGVKTHFEIPKSIESHLTILPTVAHPEAIKEMQSSDALLLLHPNNGRKGVYTGKIFEYLATTKPIIAFVDSSDVASDLIKKCNAGYVSDFDNIEGIKEVIMNVYNDWKSDIIKEVDMNVIKMHHRKEQVKRLESLIEELMNEK